MNKLLQFNASLTNALNGLGSSYIMGSLYTKRMSSKSQHSEWSPFRLSHISSSFPLVRGAYQSKTTVKYRTTLKYKNDGTALDPAISQPKPIIRQ